MNNDLLNADDNDDDDDCRNCCRGALKACAKDSTYTTAYIICMTLFFILCVPVKVASACSGQEEVV